MITKKQVGKNIGLSVTSQVVSLTVTSLIYLIVPKMIPDIQYANWQVYSLYISYVGICHLGLLDGIVLRYSQYDYDELEKTRIRSVFVFLLLLLSFFSFTVLLIGAISFKGASLATLVMVAIGIVTRNMNMYASYLFQITNRINYYALFNIGRSVIFGAFTVVLLLIGVKHFLLYCVADIAADALIFLTTYKWNKEVYFGKCLSKTDTWVEVKDNIYAGIQLMLSNWAATFLIGSAKMIVQWNWDLVFFGRVSFAFSLSSLFLTFVTAISVVLFPSLKRLDDALLPGLYASIRKAVVPILFGVLIFYFPGYKILEIWLPSYKDSLVYLGTLLPMVVFTSLTALLVNNYLKAYRCERHMFIINVSTMAFGIFIFSFAGFIMHSIDALLISTVLLIFLRTVISELIVSKKVSICFLKDNAIELSMVAAFIISTRMGSLAKGLCIYALALVVYATICFKDKLIFPGRK